MLRLSSSHLLLLLAAAIWGGGFVAQKSGLDNLGPFSFNFARFVLAVLSLVPVWFLLRKSLLKTTKSSDPRYFWLGGLFAGTMLAGGLSLQQVGLQYTTAGNAGFITGMYIVIVPLLGLLIGQRSRGLVWLGIGLAAIGLYQLSVRVDDGGFTMNYGDMLQLIGAVFWAVHVMTLGWLSKRVHDLVGVSALQFVVAAFWSLALMLWLETPQWSSFQAEWLALLYSGVMASGVSFTLQLVGQRGVEDDVAALLLSTEAVFALMMGMLFLGESPGMREAVGCGLMLVGILLTLWPEKTQVARV